MTPDHDRAEELKLQNKFAITQSGILVKANKRSRFIPEQELIIATPGPDKEHPLIDFRGEDALTSTIDKIRNVEAMAGRHDRLRQRNSGFGQSTQNLTGMLLSGGGVIRRDPKPNSKLGELEKFRIITRAGIPGE